MRLHRTLRHGRNLRNLIERKAIHQLQGNTRALIYSQYVHRPIDVEPHRVCCSSPPFWHSLEVVPRLPATHVIIQHVIGNAIEPRGEARPCLERRDARISLDESVLCQVIAQLRITERMTHEEPPHRRLIFPDKRIKGTLVVEHHDLRD